MVTKAAKITQFLENFSCNLEASFYPFLEKKALPKIAYFILDSDDPGVILWL